MIDSRSQEWLSRNIPQYLDIQPVKEVARTPFEDLNSEQVRDILNTWPPIWMHAAVEAAMQVDPPNNSLIAAIGGIASAREHTASVNTARLGELKGRHYRREWGRVGGHARESQKVYANLAEATQMALKGQGLVSTEQLELDATSLSAQP